MPTMDQLQADELHVLFDHTFIWVEGEKPPEEQRQWGVMVEAAATEIISQVADGFCTRLGIHVTDELSVGLCLLLADMLDAGYRLGRMEGDIVAR